MRKASLKLGMSLFTLLFCLGMMAQKGDGKERRKMIQEKKMTYCNEQAGLSESEAADYWALHTELMEEKKALREAVQEDPIDLDTASESEIEARIRAGLEAKIKAGELDLAYIDRFLEIVSSKKSR